MIRLVAVLGAVAVLAAGCGGVEEPQRERSWTEYNACKEQEQTPRLSNCYLWMP